jgi:Leu/Phe-tRNA-protein transferase
MKSILDPSFRYTPSFETDLRKTFDRVRLEQCFWSLLERCKQTRPSPTEATSPKETPC